MEDLTIIKGCTERRRAMLEKMDIHSVMGLLRHAPRKYVNMDTRTPLNEQRGGFCVAEIHIIDRPRVRYIRKNMSITEMTVTDGSENILCCWFNQPYRGKQDVTASYLLMGNMRMENGRKRFVNPTLERLDRAPVGLTPIYPTTAGMSQKVLRMLIRHGLSYAEEHGYFHEPVSLPLKLLPLEQAYAALHFPENEDQLAQAKERMKYEEVLYFASAMELLEGKCQKAMPVKRSAAERRRFLDSLPFSLTVAQQNVIHEIEQDMASDHPMNRLLQGDVGCGKTIVAVYAMYANVQEGYQCAMMSPTEVLSAQNEQALKTYLQPLGIRVAHLTGGMKKRERQAILEQVEQGTVDILTGTHALLQDDVSFAKLNLVITDEQHRFGVRQRAKLSQRNVHTLIMSATPIPRTLALIAFGKLQLSVIDQLPPGRKPVATHLISPAKRIDMYRFIREECQKGAQAYIVCPAIDQSEFMDLQSAKEIFAELTSGPFRGLNVQILHGRQKSEEKLAILTAFRQGKIQALVSTTVIEVGVNVPSATVMVIENADRFGLAALHQLRGRVGRGSEQSYCFACIRDDQSVERLKVFKSTTDGLELAKYDLSIRGMGEFLGTSQHGKFLFQYTDLFADDGVIAEVQQYLHKLTDPARRKDLYAETLKRYPTLLSEVVLN